MRSSIIELTHVPCLYWRSSQVPALEREAVLVEQVLESVVDSRVDGQASRLVDDGVPDVEVLGDDHGEGGEAGGREGEAPGVEMNSEVRLRGERDREVRGRDSRGLDVRVRSGRKEVDGPEIDQSLEGSNAKLRLWRIQSHLVRVRQPESVLDGREERGRRERAGVGVSGLVVESELVDVVVAGGERGGGGRRGGRRGGGGGGRGGIHGRIVGGAAGLRRVVSRGPNVPRLERSQRRPVAVLRGGGTEGGPEEGGGEGEH